VDVVEDGRRCAMRHLTQVLGVIRYNVDENVSDGSFPGRFASLEVVSLARSEAPEFQV
jgi:hypothetical protein